MQSEGRDFGTDEDGIPRCSSLAGVRGASIFVPIAVLLDPGISTPLVMKGASSATDHIGVLL
jgi:hypothetical protein